MIAQMGSSFLAVRLKRNMEIFSKSAFGPIYIIDCRVTAYVVSGPQMSDRHRPE